MLGVGSLTSIFKGSIAKTAYQVIGILVILLGIYNISNAYGVIVATLSSSTEKGNMSYQNNETLQMTYTKN
ncbi:MAG: hypothetical protein LBH96_02355 [Candidatus Peribacteria bacterium]|nr:hypothetical protein [Candidatus Peribacteria bacterium]